VSHGGRLGIHVDFNRHPTLPLVRRVNTILYMNDEWRAEWNGALTLTDRKGCDQRIPPVWNRWVIFKYGPESWHGHPEPWLAPEGTPRRSIAMYYYQPLEGDLAFTGTNYAQ
jgi:Rps23 Pro-64 3,4-dihydroxylase Tpa1-like proline 4-hydroxylase